MEFEKILFRVHEKILSSRVWNKLIRGCFFLSLTLVLVLIPLFIFANAKYRNSSYCLFESVKNYTEDQKNLTDGELAIKPEYVSYIKVVSLTLAEINNSSTNNTAINDTEIYLLFEFSGDRQILTMNSTIRKTLNTKEINFTIPMDCYADTWIKRTFLTQFIDFEAILVNEVLNTFNKFDKHLKNNFTGQVWSWSQNDVQSYYQTNGFFPTFFDRFFGLIKLVFGYFLCSSITALYIKIIIICAPIFILTTYSCFSGGEGDQEARLNVYRAFPWIGIYLYALLVNGQRKQSYMILAFVSLIIVFYFLYLSALEIWSLLLFDKPLPSGLDQSFYGFVAFLELLTLLFIRTRSTIKWFPRLSAILILCFLYYVQFTAYGFCNMALIILIFSVFALFTFHLLTFEIAALSWERYATYTPSVSSPRTLFFPAFSLGWYQDLPQIWTMFYPLFGRSTFTSAQLAMVDRNGALLQQTLEEAYQRGENLHQDAANDQNNNQEAEALDNQNNPDNQNNAENANNNPPNANNSDIEMNAAGVGQQ